MAGGTCPYCGAPVGPAAAECEFCGRTLTAQQPTQQPYVQQPYTQQPQAQQPYAQQPYVQQTQPQIVIQQTAPPQAYMPDINPAWPIRSKVVAGILALLLGGLGIHKFYLGKTGMGILYLCFSWTAIPALVGLVEGSIYLCSNDESFQLKNHVRIV